jgi:hypothetical protein
MHRVDGMWTSDITCHNITRDVHFKVKPLITEFRMTFGDGVNGV